MVPQKWIALEGVPSQGNLANLYSFGQNWHRNTPYYFHDGRVVPPVPGIPPYGFEVAIVRCLGVLLLNLLRRNHIIPVNLINAGYVGTLKKVVIR